MSRICLLFLVVILFSGCFSLSSSRFGEGFVVPAQEFSQAVKDGRGEQFSIFDSVSSTQKEERARLAAHTPGAKFEHLELRGENGAPGDPRYLQQGLVLRGRVEGPQTYLVENRQQAPEPQLSTSSQMHNPFYRENKVLPPGTSAPYIFGQKRSNPSLWPDEGQGASLFRDFRAFQPMDVITIVINESSSGEKKAETDADTEFSIVTGLEEFFGIETSKLAANNTSLDPTRLIAAETTSEFAGEGETKRSGTLNARMSAVIMEVLPNGLLRVEGTKIIAVNSEEEVMVISGLVRTRDITASNQVDSSRIANMRIDFYGRGLVADQQTPGWGARLIRWIWPF